MGKNCEFCTEWQEHWYWSHMADENKHFFKFMVGDFTESMSIPDEFAKNFNGHISEEVNLKFPSGKSWSIEVASDTGDAVLLRSGWKEFVSAHSIEQGDCLLFKKYSGPSSFDVLMLDSNGCEKTSPHPVENHGRETAQNSAGVGGHNHAFSKTQDRGPPIDGEGTGLQMTLHTSQRHWQEHFQSMSTRPVPRYSDEQAHLAKEGYEDLGLDDDGEAASAKTGYYFCKNGPVAEFHLTEEDKEEILIVRVPVEPSKVTSSGATHLGGRPVRMRRARTRNPVLLAGTIPEQAAPAAAVAALDPAAPPALTRPRKPKKEITSEARAIETQKRGQRRVRKLARDVEQAATKERELEEERERCLQEAALPKDGRPRRCIPFSSLPSDGKKRDCSVIDLEASNHTEAASRAVRQRGRTNSKLDAKREASNLAFEETLKKMWSEKDAVKEKMLQLKDEQMKEFIDVQKSKLAIKEANAAATMLAEETRIMTADLSLMDESTRAWFLAKRKMIQEPGKTHGFVYFSQGISSEFAGKYMGAVGREIVLKRAGRRGRWHARFVSGDYCQGLSGCGWRDFVRDTGILPKDVCLFELLEGARRPPDAMSELNLVCQNTLKVPSTWMDIQLWPGRSE
ncbi:LOW QUALITY PROTEIN: B3 domain-containing protein Os03g0622100-like [Brachypodium distachyon]|uniref:LOW QUALITY PROTEIN: B3 domain-containing protein Os03g0622100-like n=1 Tax=Brachypodium distachyon TaxID=15368 RepID=UPI000D0D0BA0|nr:LOW QUALITY PROTEIN: B3 domain-containing protein Os03g0622100-like [Brachypodium distachyon]|eukprot:XP_024312585.1 LOW QUALITY PROTEIN: B3 domain-containing protein Os03g0622100-like [Brachypodium distachyon]